MSTQVTGRKHDVVTAIDGCMMTEWVRCLRSMGAHPRSVLRNQQSHEWPVFASHIDMWRMTFPRIWGPWSTRAHGLAARPHGIIDATDKARESKLISMLYKPLFYYIFYMCFISQVPACVKGTNRIESGSGSVWTGLHGTELAAMYRSAQPQLVRCRLLLLTHYA